MAALRASSRRRSAPLGAFAQTQRKVWRIGFLAPYPEPSAAEKDGLLEEFRKGMGELGYVEGKDYVTERRYGDGHYERLPGLAAELVAQKVDLMLTTSTPATQAAQKATTTIPIVMGLVADPVGSGIVANLARPGGNTTGISNFAGDLGPKHLDLLRGVLPRLSRVAVLVNPGNASHPPTLKSIQAAAQPAGVKIVSCAARTAADIDSAFSAMSRESVEAVILAPDTVFGWNHARIAHLAMQGRLASISEGRGFAFEGGLMAYGGNPFNQYRRAASLAVKILKGANPANLPVEQDADLRLVINLKTAKALGLTIPESTLIRAYRVIQ